MLYSNVSGVESLGSGALSWALRAFPLVALPACLQKVRNGNFDIVSGDARDSRVEVVERGFPRISARGYIIISKVNIYY